MKKLYDVKLVCHVMVLAEQENVASAIAKNIVSDQTPLSYDEWQTKEVKQESDIPWNWRPCAPFVDSVNKETSSFRVYFEKYLNQKEIDQSKTITLNGKKYRLVEDD